jgi:tetratricopeptide (TPR) repeat protein
MRNHYILTWLLLATNFCSCQKYLDAKSDAKLALLSTVEDIQTLLDNPNMNLKSSNYIEAGADNFYVSSADWDNLITTATFEAKVYRWEKAVEAGGGLDNRWIDQYNNILQANVALDGLEKLKNAPVGSAAWNNVKGSALFFRGFYFYILSQLFVPPYDASVASSKLGLALRLDPDFEKPSVRATIQETYDRILADLKEAAGLLPNVPLVKTRPCKPAAYGMIARTYLSMRMYDSAGIYANKSLQIYDSLIDFNTLNPNANAPIARFNKEVIFHARTAGTSQLLAPARAKVDTLLFKEYDNNDLRKTVYFTNTYSFKADYDGGGANASGYVFMGVATDELFLTRAESHARTGNIDLAMQDLNALLQKRWKTGLFTPLTAADQSDAIRKILAERRKELFFRGARWPDMRRLKYDPEFAVTPQRVINNQIYTLPLNSDQYTLQIPQDVITLSGIEQNP